MGTGKLIVFEGVQGEVEKTTQLKMLKEHLRSEKVKFVEHSFPTYYAYQGKGVEKYLAGEFGEPGELSPYFINNLFAYDRAITWRVKLKTEFEKGKLVLLDHYTSSSLISQSALFSDSAEKKAFIDFVMDYEYHKLGIKQPDSIFFLTMPFEMIALQNTDASEEALELLRRAYENAEFVANYCGWTSIDCANSNNSLLSSEEIHAKIWQQLKNSGFLSAM